jgi:PAS domain S-box-containing protein
MPAAVGRTGSTVTEASRAEPHQGTAESAARIAALERENRRAFEDAQREADALFAQYQLSQILASGGSPAELGRTVILELTRLANAEAGAIWLGESDVSGLALVASTGELDGLPARLEDASDARRLSLQRHDLEFIVLAEDPPATILAFRAATGQQLDQDGLRVAQLARHEMAVAFAGARLRDVVERERQELAAVVDGATDAILQVDDGCRITRLNPAAERMLGAGAEELLGLACGDALGCDVAGGHGTAACPLRDVLDGGDPIAYRETAIRGDQAASLHVAGSYFRAPAPHGGSMRATAILRDLTSARALEELREGFVATVSHELRTPLALVRGYAETLLHFELSADESRSYVERIQQVTTRLAVLVTQILDVTHLNADPLVLEPAPASFASLVARLSGDLSLSGQDHRLVVEVPTDLPPIEADAGRVGQVLENLVGNALKYAPGESRVVIGAAVEGDWLLAWVDDEGIGVPEAERSLVTEPFHRAWNVRESRIAGTGLGLYICRRLVEAHGGRLSIGDRPDGRPGSRVVFTLPLMAERRGARRTSGPRRSGTASGGPRRG